MATPSCRRAPAADAAPAGPDALAVMPPRARCYAMMNTVAASNHWPVGKWAYGEPCAPPRRLLLALCRRNQGFTRVYPC